MTIEDIFEYAKRKAEDEVSVNFPSFRFVLKNAQSCHTGQNIYDVNTYLEMFEKKGLTHAIQYYKPIYEELKKEYM